jgi:hypothetical protein
MREVWVAHDNLEGKDVDAEWEERHGWLLMDCYGFPVIVSKPNGDGLCDVEVDFIEQTDLIDHNMTINERITFRTPEKD